MKVNRTFKADVRFQQCMIEANARIVGIVPVHDDGSRFEYCTLELVHKDDFWVLDEENPYEPSVSPREEFLQRVIEQHFGGFDNTGHDCDGRTFSNGADVLHVDEIYGIITLRQYVGVNV